MKTTQLILAIAALGVATLTRAESPAGGPKGGRLLESTPLKAEFHVDESRKAEVIFYDAGMNAVSPGEATVAITAEPASGRMPVEVVKTPHGFASTVALPEGGPYRVVVQVRASPGARPQNFRIDLNLGLCGECNRAEYACICEGH